METVNIPMEELAPLLLTQLEADGRTTLTVTGSSMLPMLRSRRDRVVLGLPTTLRAGNIILYRRENGAYILHRIIRCLPEGEFLCCGDNQWEPETVCREQILAVVTAYIKNQKTRSVDSRLYKCYAGIWTGLFPVRRPLIRLRRGLGRLRLLLKRRMRK